MMTFYMAPGSCSTGIHILLEELELLFSAHVVNLPAGEQFSEAYRAVNPRATIPALVLDDGSTLTSYLGISWWLAETHPARQLLPGSPPERAVVLDWLGYITGTVHGLGYTRIFTPGAYCEEHELPVQKAALHRQGIEIVAQGLSLLSGLVRENGHCLLPHFNLLDPALFYLEFWADKTGIAMPEPCRHHYRTMLNRPLVQQVLREEGYRV